MWRLPKPLRPLSVLLCLAAGTIASAQDAAPENPGLRPDQHAWARFAPGAWKRVRVSTETLDGQGKVASTAVQETTTRLEKVEGSFVTLTIEGSTEVGGQTLPMPPQVVVQGLSGQPAEGESKIRALPDGSVTIEETPIDCRVEQLEVTTQAFRTVTTNYYADQPPYLLRVESNSKELGGEGSATISTMEVLALEMPYAVDGRIRACSLLKMTQKHSKGSTLTMAYSSLDVPGGIVAFASRERDSAGRVVRRSTMELVAYDGQPAALDAAAAVAP